MARHSPGGPASARFRATICWGGTRASGPRSTSANPSTTATFLWSRMPASNGSVASTSITITACGRRRCGRGAPSTLGRRPGTCRLERVSITSSRAIRGRRSTSACRILAVASPTARSWERGTFRRPGSATSINSIERTVMSRVAIVEDHERLAGMIRQALAAAGIEADLFRNVREASYGVGRADFAVLIIDRGLPDGDGLAFLRALRATGQMTPCLMLTARDALHDRVDGLESGADAYETKPFAMRELVARVRTLMRRPVALTALVLSFADITVDPQLRAMRCGAQSVLLAPAELQVMLCLVKAAGQTVQHAALEHAA